MYDYCQIMFILYLYFSHWQFNLCLSDDDPPAPQINQVDTSYVKICAHGQDFICVALLHFRREHALTLSLLIDLLREGIIFAGAAS